jgi:hypothetical protein
LAPALVAGLVLLPGCGANERGLVQAKVNQLAQATASKNYRALCQEVFAPRLLAHLALSGLSCERAMQIALSDVQDPVLSIGKITVKGHKASAITLSGARAQQGSIDEIGLVKTSQGWRVASLASPAGTDQASVNGR